MSDLQPPTFGNGTVTQCEPITVSWEVSAPSCFLVDIHTHTHTVDLSTSRASCHPEVMPDEDESPFF